MNLILQQRGGDQREVSDFSVGFLQARNLARETLDCPFAAAGTDKFVDIRKVAGTRHGHSERVGHGLAAT
jgi:hypothetical protein